MATEIERKFLAKEGPWRKLEATRYRQGYLNRAKERTVRVRTAGEKAYLTIKGITVGAARAEYEYEIPLRDAEELLDQLCEKPLIEKNRYRIEHAGKCWEVDEFLGDNAGLILAEVELQSEDEGVDLPEWAGQEVTGDPRYFNSNLAKRPFSQWSDSGAGADAG